MIAALGRDDDSVRERRQRSADGLLALALGVRVGAVDVAQASADRLLQEGDVLTRVREPICAEPDRATSVSPILSMVVVLTGACSACS